MATAEHTAEVQHETSTGLDNTKLAMWAFLGSECLFFGSLISTYLLYRTRAAGGTGPDRLLPQDATVLCRTLFPTAFQPYRGSQHGDNRWLS